ncbi:hypothetical protein SRB5_49690 [Streptomyces sp. RB5]|uniref:Uncharacterized protein n=1 Tax=Streptomyces smaragdinus TaxID=2585196 RepID=A0A7K0CNE4_9ACTN|nr:hypothetical protein [Streptomyces smaragdinus]MQY14793.1 hypothetical protein [Streptomyces smaragdinus]
MTPPAIATLAATTVLPEYIATLPCEPASARRARKLIAMALSAWQLDALLESNCQFLWIDAAAWLCAEVFVEHLPGSGVVDEHVGAAAVS